MATVYPDLTGLIFARPKTHGTSPGHWKITGPARMALGIFSYPVIKCSKHGKEYKQANGFAASYVLRLKEEGQLYEATKEGKASTDGIETGIRKRRIDFLVKTMQDMVEELNGLLEEEARSEVYELIVK